MGKRLRNSWRAAPALFSAAAAVLFAACGGSVILEEGKGGSGGAGGEGSSQVSNGTTGPGPSTVVSVGSGTSGCLKCADFITQGMGELCPESEGLYKEFYSCVCAQNCIPQCGSNVCAGSSATDDCVGCISSACADQFNKCADDF